MRKQTLLVASSMLLAVACSSPSNDGPDGTEFSQLGAKTDHLSQPATELSTDHAQAILGVVGYALDSSDLQLHRYYQLLEDGHRLKTEVLYTADEGTRAGWATVLSGAEGEYMFVENISAIDLLGASLPIEEAAVPEALVRDGVAFRTGYAADDIVLHRLLPQASEGLISKSVVLWTIPSAGLGGVTNLWKDLSTNDESSFVEYLTLTAAQVSNRAECAAICGSRDASDGCYSPSECEADCGMHLHTWAQSVTATFSECVATAPLCYRRGFDCI